MTFQTKIQISGTVDSIRTPLTFVYDEIFGSDVIRLVQDYLIVSRSDRYGSIRNKNYIHLRVCNFLNMDINV